MAYGLNLFNSKGERVVEFKSTLYALASGNSKPHDTMISDANAIATAAGYPTSQRRLYFVSSYGFLPESDIQFAEQNAWAASIDGFRVLGPQSNLTVGDTVFYRVDSVGLTGQLQVFCDFGGSYPLDKGVGIVRTENNAAIPYVQVSTVAPSASGENYGLLVRDDAGTVTFDSRKPLFSVFHAEVIPSTLFDDVLQNNATRTLTLPKSVAGAYISMPAFTNFLAISPGGNTIDCVMVKQTNATTLTFTKKRVYGTDDTGTVRLWTQDTPLFVGRPL